MTQIKQWVGVTKREKVESVGSYETLEKRIRHHLEGGAHQILLYHERPYMAGVWNLEATSYETRNEDPYDRPNKSKGGQKDEQQ